MNAPLTIAGRVLLALLFIAAGAAKFANLGGTAGMIASKGLPLPMLVAAAVAALELLGGIALAAGFKARWAAGALAVFTVLASFLFHNFWAMPAEQQMVNQLMFMKNLAIAGGMLLVVSFGAGAGSVDARRRLTAA